MSDEQQRQKMNSLEDKSQIYKLFCENGYTKTYNEFETEMSVFLNSEDSKKLINNNFDELSDEMLEMMAGGVNTKQAVTAGIATLLTTFTIGAIGHQILSQTNTMPPSNTDTSSISSSTQDDSNFSSDTDDQSTNDNGGTSTNKSNRNKTMTNRKGPDSRLKNNNHGRPGQTRWSYWRSCKQ